MLAVIGRVHQALRDCGPNTRDEPAVARWLGDEQRFAYLAPDGFLAYRWQHGNDELLVERAVASSACGHPGPVGRGRLTFLHRSNCPGDCRARRPGAVADDRPRRAADRPEPWMLRVVDATAAVAARGFPAGVGLTTVLRLADPDRPGHDGWWTLDVGGGKGTLTPAGPGPDGVPASPRPGGGAGPRRADPRTARVRRTVRGHPAGHAPPGRAGGRR